jgi:hypothetical protein
VPACARLSDPNGNKLLLGVTHHNERTAVIVFESRADKGTIIAAPIKRPYIWDLAPSASAIRCCSAEFSRLTSGVGAGVSAHQ